MSFLESQIEQRNRYNAELIERAYADLAASVIAESEAPVIETADLEMIDVAVTECLRYCGIAAGDVSESVKDPEERVEWMCRPSGTMRRKVRLDENWQNRAFGAMMGQLETGEYVALLPRGIRGYDYVEPGSKRRVKVTKEMARSISQEATLFYRPLPARPLTLRDLTLFVFKAFDRTDYLLVFIGALAMTLIGMFPAQAYKLAFDVVIPSGDARLVGPLLGVLLGVTASSALIGICRNLVMERLTTKLDLTVQAATFARVLSLPASFFKKYSSGNLASRVLNVELLAMKLSSLLLGAGLSAVLSLVYVFQIGAYTPQLAIPALVIVLLQGGLTVAVTVITMRYERVTMEESVTLSGTVTALLNGIQKIKLAGAEDRAFHRWATEYARYARSAYNRPAFMRALPAMVTFVGLVGNIIIYYLAGSSDVNISNYMAFNVAYGMVTAAIMQLAQMSGEVAQIRPMLELVSPILKATPEVGEDKPSITSLNGSIEMSDVSFRYGEDLPDVVHDLSFSIRPGEYVGIVGKSGCGKSTIMRLLLGFEVPRRGTIFYGQYQLGEVDLRSLRSKIGSVMQDGRLFMGDIRSNITISAPTATLEDAWEAAEIAGIADDIRKMPMGMQTMVSEGGGGISGGQRQRLLIARAVCGSRKILFFDEATSALDNKTQLHVTDALAKLNCTRVVIAHRLSTVRHCDRILVIDKGQIIEEGNYDELMALNGSFAKLVARQRIEESSV